MYFIGIDIGSQVARVIISDEKGNIAAAVSSPITNYNLSNITDYFEQDTNDWWKSVKQSLKKTLKKFLLAGFNPKKIIALSIDGTSGTVLALDKKFSLLMDSIIYKDTRASESIDFINNAARNIIDMLGYRFNPSFALPKKTKNIDSE